MHPSLALLAPLALLLPAPSSGPPETQLAPQSGADALAALPEMGPLPVAEVPVAEQVRIEQRTVVRVSPPSTSLRRAMAIELVPVAPARMSERKMGKCVAVAGIAAVQPDAGGKILLFMRDQRLISASLEKTCSARDFYSGFYVERNKDGMLCVDRDKLHSRAGASCEVGKMRQVVVDDD